MIFSNHNEISDLNLEPKHLLCYVHSLPFVGHPRELIIEYAYRGIPEITKTPWITLITGGNALGLKVILEDRPLCCRLSATSLLQLYVQLHVTSRRGLCSHCRDRSLIVNVPMTGDVCLYCLCYDPPIEVQLSPGKSKEQFPGTMKRIRS